MKIAILSPFYPFRGGMAQFSGRLYSELIKKNEVKAFSFKTLYPGFLFPGKTQFVEKDDPALQVDSDRILSTVNPFSYIATAKKINKYAPDILIVPYWMSLLAPVYGIVSFLIKKKIKIIGLIHNAIPHEKRFFDTLFAKFFFKRCDGFIVLSEPVKADLLKLMPSAKILLSPHPIYDHYNAKTDANEAKTQLGLIPDKKTLLFFGLIREYKGLDLLIESMSLLDNDYQLIIAGESYEDFDKYQSLIDDSPFRDNIKVLQQYIPDNMVSILFSASDVLVLPYRSATQSGVVAVAYQLETPMIATNVGALGEAIRLCDTGLVIDEVSPTAIACGVKEYFDNEEKKIEYIRNIRTEKQRLSWSVFAEAIEDFLKK